MIIVPRDLSAVGSGVENAGVVPTPCESRINPVSWGFAELYTIHTPYDYFSHMNHQE